MLADNVTQDYRTRKHFRVSFYGQSSPLDIRIRIKSGIIKKSVWDFIKRKKPPFSFFVLSFSGDMSVLSQ